MNSIKVPILLLFGIFAAVAACGQTVVRGVVTDVDGAAIVGARVRLVADRQAAPSQTTTDLSGRFSIDLGAANSGKLIAESAGFLPSEKKITVADLTSGEIIFVLAPSPVSAEISVTRSETRIEDTPASVVALDNDDLNLTAAQTLDDKLRQVPGFSLFRRAGSRTANPTTQGVSLRGVGPSGASRALVLWDDVPLNDPFGGWIYWGRVPGEAIRDVEVLRGSASDLYGSSALGGVIAVTSRRPEESAAGSLQLSAGTMDTQSMSGFVSGGLRKLRGSLGVELLRTDGFVTVAEEFRGPVDVRANVRYATLAPEIEYNFGERRRIFSSGTYYRENRGNGTPLQFNDTRIRSVVFGADVDELSIRAYLTSQVYHQSFTAIAADRLTENLIRLQRVPAQGVGLNASWTKSFASRFTIFTGADAREIRGRSDENAINNFRVTSLVSSGGRELTIGAFAGGSFIVNSRIVLSGGVRVDRWRNFSGYSATRVLSTNATSGTRFPDRSAIAVSPRVSILVKVRPNLSFSSTFSTGFRQPTLNELYRAFRVGDILTLANENLRAERAVNGEAGVIYSTFGRRLFVRGNFFCTQISKPVANVTLIVAPALITRQRQNLGSLRSCGVETDWEASLPKDLKLSGGYLFVDARVKEFPANRTLEGLRIPQVADHQFSLQVQYSNPKIITGALQMRASSAQFDDDQNQLRLSGYTTFDALVRKNINRNFSVFAAVENLFDQRIEAGRTPVLTIASPRFLRVGIRLEFSNK